MKKLSTILVLLFTTLIFAQEKEDNTFIEKGVWSLEGDFSVNTRQNENFYENNKTSRDVFSFGIAPKIGYAISDDLILGLGIGYNYSKSDVEHDQALIVYLSKSNSLSIFPYIKKFIPVTEKFAFHLQGEASYSTGSITYEDNDTIDTYDSDHESYFVGIRPGINYKLTNNILIQASFGSLGYDYVTQESDSTERSKASSFGLNLSSSSLFFGMTVLL